MGLDWWGRSGALEFWSDGVVGEGTGVLEFWSGGVVGECEGAEDEDESAED